MEETSTNFDCKRNVPICNYNDCLEGAVLRHFKIQNIRKVELEYFLFVSQTFVVNTLKNELKRLLNLVKLI